MVADVNTKNAQEVESEVLEIYRSLFPTADPSVVSRAFLWVNQCFNGRYADYQPIDARYHDLEHTLQGTLCLARLLHGRHQTETTPSLTDHWFELSLLAILFHDTGYLKKKEDTEGTGAKYTMTHVSRSADFAQAFLEEKRYSPESIQAVRNMIRCTGVNADLGSIPFQSEIERTLGFALASSDLLGQMAASDYVDKLPILHMEFAEALAHDRQRASRLGAYDSPEALIRNTPSFWENYVLRKIDDDFGKLYRFLNDPYPDGPNPYLERIQKNLERIQREFPPASPHSSPPASGS
jgi:hypothetical protein